MGCFDFAQQQVCKGFLLFVVNRQAQHTILRKALQAKEKIIVLKSYNFNTKKHNSETLIYLELCIWINKENHVKR